MRLEQSGGEKGAMGGSSSSLNSSASDESNRLQHQQHNSRLRSSLLHSFSTNDASIGEYKYTVTVGNQSLKITGSNLDLVRVMYSLCLIIACRFYFSLVRATFIFLSDSTKLTWKITKLSQRNIYLFYLFFVYFILLYNLYASFYLMNVRR